MKRYLKWLYDHRPTKRRYVQLYAALLFNANLKGFGNGKIYTGDLKSMCAPGINCYSCPGASAACPLGALQNALASSGKTLPFYIFGIIMLYGLLFGRFICSFLCPFGFIQDMLYKIKTPKLKKNRVTYVLSYLKYIILAVFVIAIPLIFAGLNFPLPGFCKYICPAGTLEGAVGLLSNSANESQLGMLGPLFTWKFVLLVGFVVASVFIYRFFCRFFCPMGAIYGLFNKFCLFGIKLDESKCTNCGLCITKCKLDVRKVGDAECISCGECMSYCTPKAIQWKGSRFVLAPSDVAILDDDEATAEQKESVENKRQKRMRIVKIVGGVLATALLAGALIYYNFIDKVPTIEPPAPPTDSEVAYGNTVGSLCYEQDLTTYASNGTAAGEVLNIKDLRGKVTVLNFWYTSCGPCLAELPHFNEAALHYGEDVQIIAVHSYIYEGEIVQDFINNEADLSAAQTKYADYAIKFCQDRLVNGLSYYDILGGMGSYPMTVVINAEGVITFTQQGSVTADELNEAIENALRFQ
jgi:thiol-disulfide isomerase/thioredoxin/Fe-S-cluster-containing hydrogenase component 2